MNARLRHWWELLRTLATDDAYERYVEHHRAAHFDSPILDRRAFYLQQQQRKWTGIQRCC
ncbi:MAG: CstA-like transporter-associated (seleno)protein [Povalibacter sp.]|jgi:uncharacterized short protein YbdD (DUF466 family)